MAKGNGHSALFKRANVSVVHAGETVTLEFGNVEIVMHYADALQFSQWVRLHAKAAKRESGDKSRVIQLVGILSDAEDNYRRGI